MPKFPTFLKKTKPDSAYSKSALAAGTKVEMEHTNSKFVAKQIAKKHLDESPEYYKFLKKMEMDLRKDHKKK